MLFFQEPLGPNGGMSKPTGMNVKIIAFYSGFTRPQIHKLFLFQIQITKKIW